MRVAEFKFQRGPYDVVDYFTLAQHASTHNIVLFGSTKVRICF